MSGSQNHVDAIIVGAGFAGLYQLYSFRALGITVSGVREGP